MLRRGRVVVVVLMVVVVMVIVGVHVDTCLI